MTAEAERACPACGRRGRKVERLTLESLLSARAKARLKGASEFRFCRTPGCDVVYYRPGGGERFVSGDVRVPIFQKSSAPWRFVCYCFEHRVDEIEDEVGRTGASAAFERITDKCRQGLDRCKETNPQGACCLGNVRQVVKAATCQSAWPERDGTAGGGRRPDCCALAAAGEESGAPRHDARGAHARTQRGPPGGTADERDRDPQGAPWPDANDVNLGRGCRST